MSSVRAHSKQSAEFKFTAQVYPKFYPPFETVIYGKSSIYVFSESPFKMVDRIRSLLKFTAQVYLPESPSSLLPESPSSLLPESPSSLLPESPSSLLPVTFKFTPPHLKWSLMAHQVLADLCLQSESIQNCSSLLLRFTP